MYTSPSLAVAAFALLARIVVGAPPACFLAAIGAQPNPSNLTVLCDSGYLEGNITSKCSGNDAVAALSAYSASCSAAGVTVSITSAPSSATTTTTESDTASTAGAPFTTAVTTGTSASSTASSNSGSQGYSPANSTLNSTSPSSGAAVPTGIGSIPVSTTSTSAPSNIPVAMSSAVARASFSSIRFQVVAILSLAAIQAF